MTPAQERRRELELRRNRLYKQRWREKKAGGEGYEPTDCGLLQGFGTFAFCPTRGTRNGKPMFHL